MLLDNLNISTKNITAGLMRIVKTCRKQANKHFLRFHFNWKEWCSFAWKTLSATSAFFTIVAKISRINLFICSLMFVTCSPLLSRFLPRFLSITLLFILNRTFYKKISRSQKECRTINIAHMIISCKSFTNRTLTALYIFQHSQSCWYGQ